MATLSVPGISGVALFDVEHAQRALAMLGRQTGIALARVK
jgi:hypothetical protein